MKHVTVFTDYYPEPNKEFFIDTERPYLAGAFDSVTYAPEHVTIGENHWTRKAKIVLAGMQSMDFLTRPTIQNLVYMGKVAAIRRWVDRQKPKGLLYSYWFKAAATAIAGHHPCIARAHNDDLYEEQHPSGRIPMRRETLTGLDFVYPCSLHGSNYLVKKFPSFAHKIKTARLGVNRLPVRVPWTPEKAVRIISCCGLEPYKCPLMLIDVVREVAKYASVRWVHVGDGSMHNAFWKAAHLLPDVVRYRLWGTIPNREVHELYANNSFDVFLLTSEWEGLPVAIMEALAYGVPVVCRDAGGCREAVANGGGFCFGQETAAVVLATGVMAAVKMGNEMSNTAEAAWSSDFQADINLRNFAREVRAI